MNLKNLQFESTRADGLASNGHLDIGVFGIRGIPSTYGGYETFLTGLLPALAARGHRVTLYGRRGHCEPGEYEGVTRVVLPVIESKQLGTISHGAVSAVRARVAGHDVVLTFNVANAVFGLLLTGSGQRVVMNTDGQEWLRGKWGRLGQTYFRLSARIARLSASLISDSVAMRNVYQQDFGSNSTVIPYCCGEIHQGDLTAVAASLDLESHGYFLIAGRLIPENNIDRVARAYVKSSLAQPLLILGAANYDSPVERSLRQLAADDPRIRLGGHIHDRSAYATLVHHSAAYVHAHSVGGINPALLEAMGCGARILALSTPFNREALGRAGSYFSDFTTELPRKLQEISVADSTETLEYRYAAEARVSEVFDARTVAASYEELLLEVCKRHPWSRVVLPTVWDNAANILGRSPAVLHETPSVLSGQAAGDPAGENREAHEQG